ncbi:hypothetical protein EW145_g6501 [Phellinidium pouzarii]|uniref:Glycosyltransferase family 15 protein n=1 Tax=Phellinidium pouzarii TaxID=167371 RepID=A0A4S4KXK4_9AGAM|nr:hypothetical protein EW145_g6501 [Phellinidium pouzarii]
MPKMFEYLRIRSLASIPKPVRYLIAFIGLVSMATMYFFYISSEDTLVSTFPEEEIIDELFKPIVPDDVRISPPVDPITKLANATILVLARNSDINGVEKSMRSLEARFNHAYGYPWTFLNEVPFSDEFKTRVSVLTEAETQFGLVPSDQWYQPDWINEELVEKGKTELLKLKTSWPIPYASSTPYRNMCRYNSGFFFRHELLEQYKWYWRVEPDVDFTCDITFDPFVYMIENNKRYSFIISLEEVKPTVPSLWDTIKDFRTAYPDLIAEDNALPFISNDAGETYNYCHFWSNFEIADLDFFRSPIYLAYFDFLDATGNFYYERWGDAPVHSIAAALFLPRSQLHFFNDIGYYHPPFQHCPQGTLHSDLHCSCNSYQNYDYTGASCLRTFQKLFPDGQVG